VNDIVRQKLQYVITQYGRSLCDEPKCCEEMLWDLCPEYKREVNVLVSALKENVAAELITATADVFLKELLLKRLTQRLYDNLGIAEKFAQWSVESWILALTQYKEPLTGADFVYIPPGEFMMGSPEDESGRCENEILHRVRLTRGFYIQTTQIKQGQWKKLMGNNPYYFKGEYLPVENVSWNDAVEFCEKLSRNTDRTYRLPTEAEWEYACRAGTQTVYNWGDRADCSRANYGNGWSEECKGKNPGKTMPVASFLSNAWGLYDMHGNVWEWCNDWYGDYPTDSVVDPMGPSSGSDRVLRGGGWIGSAEFCRSATRFGYSPDLRDSYVGFRPVLLESHQ